MRTLILGVVMLSCLSAATEYVSPTLIPIIEADPPMLVTCRVQAFIMPVGELNPYNQTVIMTELVEKGIKIDRILPYGRVSPGSFYAFGSVSETAIASIFDMKKHKLKVAAQLRRGFLVSFNFRTQENSIKLLGCTTQQLE